jgi:hypothetical protein
MRRCGWLLLLAAACSFDDSIPNGRLKCGDSEGCPAGYTCVRLEPQSEPVCCRGDCGARDAAIAPHQVPLDGPHDLASRDDLARGAPDTASAGLPDARGPDAGPTPDGAVATPDAPPVTPDAPSIPDAPAPAPDLAVDTFTCAPAPAACQSATSAFCSSATTLEHCTRDARGCITLGPPTTCSGGMSCSGSPAACRCAIGVGDSCGCGGVVQCDGTCSKPPPSDLGKPCGRCGGTRGCDGKCSKSDDSCPLLDFGGVFGWVDGAQFSNPATGTWACPAGYTTMRVFGTSTVDHDFYYCYRTHQPDGAPALEFGGMTGSVDGSWTVNPFTGAATCPNGFNMTRVYGRSGIDWDVSLCHRPGDASRPQTYWFAGMFGVIDGSTQVKNPLNDLYGCPTPYTAKQILGQGARDMPLYFCYATPPP